MSKLHQYLKEGRTYIIAEMSGNHGGSVEHALKIVEAAHEAGADCLKMQTYTADTITINAHTDPFLIKQGLWEKEYLYDLYTRAHTPWEWHRQIKEETERRGMDFLSTPFDFTAVDFLEELGVSMYKIASFEAVDLPLIEKVASCKKPVILSCGMASKDEIREAVDTVFATGNKDLILLKCCSAYPSAPSQMHLRTISDMRDTFHVPVGLSDHSAGSLASQLAVAHGAVVIEKHLCISKDDDTADAAFSLDKDEFAQLVKDIRAAEEALGPSAVYGPDEGEMTSYALRRSLFAVKDIAAGEKLTPDNIRSIRPAQGLHPRHYKSLIRDGYAARAIPFGTPLSEEDVRYGEP